MYKNLEDKESIQNIEFKDMQDNSLYSMGKGL